MKGDSFKYGKTGGEVGWVELDGDYLNLAVFNPAVPGENPANIALRRGDQADVLGARWNHAGVVGHPCRSDADQW